jgi:hypothetical protein
LSTDHAGKQADCSEKAGDGTHVLSSVTKQ